MKKRKQIPSMFGITLLEKLKQRFFKLMIFLKNKNIENKEKTLKDATWEDLENK